MAEVLMEYGQPIVDEHAEYQATVVGRRADDGMWESWIEFSPRNGGRVLVSGVESRQPERTHLSYWASGLTPVYLEGALSRAKEPEPRATADGNGLRHASGTAAKRNSRTRVRSSVVRDAVLDPFEVGARNLDVLRQHLMAFDRDRLLDIIAIFDLNPAGEDLAWMSDPQLVHFVVTAVDQQLPQRRR